MTALHLEKEAMIDPTEFWRLMYDVMKFNIVIG
jgi:hypothetical protein